MKKIKALLGFSCTVLLLALPGFLVLTTDDIWSAYTGPFDRLCAWLLGIWVLGCLFLCLWKREIPGLFRKVQWILRILAVSVIAVFALLCLLARQYPYKGGFQAETPLFEGKKVMIVVPHQDDEINLAGGLIEQYVENGSEVSVVFTTNGDQFGKTEIRAEEVLSVLTPLGVAKEDIYYLGFGDCWQPQTVGDTTVSHIYNAPDADALWTSYCGATATYGTSRIGHYMDLAYTRNNFLLSLETLISRLRPDTVFAVDFDSHIDHRASSLLVEEAMGRILRKDPGYTPRVYKGFCYGTAWTAVYDYFSEVNLLSTEKPVGSVWEASAMGYRWEERLRFPISQTNLNPVLSNNSVYDSLSSYSSQKARRHAMGVLNGDKVFWERRTDSLLYTAQIQIDGQTTDLLNDFKLLDFADISASSPENTGVAFTPGSTLRVTLPEAVTASQLRLYDNPAAQHNILAGSLLLSDGTCVEFGALEPEGGSTQISFPETELSWLEITVTQWEGDLAGLCEIELYADAQPDTEACIMPLDSSGNFVYDYVLEEEDSVAVRFGLFPREILLGQQDVQITFEAGSDSSCRWEEDVLVIRCAEKDVCRVTVEAGALRTTFTVSNPGAAEAAWVRVLRDTDRMLLNAEGLIYLIIDRLWLALN